MGRTYGVPRSAKGESRILYIFTFKSLAITIAAGAIGWGVSFIVKLFVPIGIVPTVIIIAPFAVLGYLIGAAKIPDSPLMGPLQKAGGEGILDILIRLATFKSKKKIYVYNVDRKLKKSSETSKTNGTVENIKKMFK